ncbi:flagellar motor protein MotB [Virgibacillus kekensis]|uniref:Flagellar motor protein MotB n=1 Tax=Virgibacillus kekensis TaxID=202261 RepID=A0ABV9DIW7_9BACI
MRRKKKNSEEHMSESWLLPYADLLTLLLALFIVLFAMSEIDTKTYKELARVFNEEFSGGKGILEHNDSSVDMPVPKEEPEEHKEEADKNVQELMQLTALQERINKYISNNNLTKSIETSLSGEGLYITITNDISFESGSAEVKGKGKDIAKDVSNFLYTDPPHEIVISGHTDDIPIHDSVYKSNWELSVMRAVNFMRIVLQNDKLEPKRFSAKGFGEHNPLVPNTSKENRAKNRRVEVLILPNYDIKSLQ